MSVKEEELAGKSAGRVSFRASEIGPVARLDAPGGSAEVALLGAQMVGWRPAGGEEMLYWPGAREGGAAEGAELHGGIPVCWPWFGRMGPEGARPHGWVRYRRFAGREVEVGGMRTAVVLEPEVQEDGVRFVVRVSVGDGLEGGFRAENRGGEALAVTAGFHPYLRVADAGEVRVEGLEGAEYVDWGSGVEGVQTGAYLPVPGSRVFGGARRRCRLVDGRSGRAVVLEAEGHVRWCVWRAEAERGNMRAGDARGFVCVEPVVFPRSDAVVLEPGGMQEMRLRLRTEEVRV
jgi:glucose-6-phosphate 1-epimerase